MKLLIILLTIIALAILIVGGGIITFQSIQDYLEEKNIKVKKG